MGEYKAKRGSNLSEQTSVLSASSSPVAPPASGPRSGTDGVLEQDGAAVSLRFDLTLFLSLSSMFETTADEHTAKRGILGRLCRR